MCPAIHCGKASSWVNHKETAGQEESPISRTYVRDDTSLCLSPMNRATEEGLSSIGTGVGWGRYLWVLPSDWVQVLTAQTFWVPTVPFCPLQLYSSRAGGFLLWVDAWVRQVEKQKNLSLNCLHLFFVFIVLMGGTRLQLHVCFLWTQLGKVWLSGPWNGNWGSVRSLRELLGMVSPEIDSSG